MKMVFSNKLLLLFFVLFTAYSIVNCCNFIMSGDDYDWLFRMKLENIIGPKAIDGRYFTNLITLYAAKNPLFKSIVCSVCMAALPCLMSKLLNFRCSGSSLPYFIAAAIILTCPRYIAGNTFAWAPGFTNYVIAALPIFTYLIYCMPLLRGEKDERSGLWAILTLIVGFLGAMCVEHVTFCNLCISIFVIAFSLISTKKVRIPHITYFIGTLVGTILVLMSTVAGEVPFGDEEGLVYQRGMEFAFGDIRTKLFCEVLDGYAWMFVFVHIAIALCLSILFARKFKSFSDEGCPKYVKLCLPVVIIFAIYSTFKNIHFEFCSLDLSMKTEAFEAALTFVYLISLIYLFYVLLDLHTFLRCLLYLLCTLALALPFLVVGPITPRCYLNQYLFWGLLAGELIVYTYVDSAKTFAFIGKMAAASVIGFYCVIFSYVAIVNSYIYDLRFDFIKRQLDSNLKILMVIRLPYPDYCPENIDMLFDTEKPYYSQLMSRYYGFDESVVYMRHQEITPSNYFDVYHED